MSRSLDFSSNLLRRLQPLAERRLHPPVYAGLYFLYWQVAAHGAAFASRRCKSQARPSAAAWLSAIETMDAEALRTQLLDYLEHYQFRGVIPNATVALAEWLRGRWRLESRADIPRPLEILRAQARGARPVTIITAYPRLLQPVLNKPHAYAFFLHDLEHAYKFFHSPALYAGQRALFTALDAALARGVFAPYLGDPVFLAKLHYLMSDMNTHPEHSRQYLRAILLEACLRREGKALDARLGPAGKLAIGHAMRSLDAGELTTPAAAGEPQGRSDRGVIARSSAAAALR